jgi:hypothetical protein
MSFPLEKYASVVNEAYSIVMDRDKKGRNSAVDFYTGFPHGSQDVSFELSRRVARILGAELVERSGNNALTPTGQKVRREDALDLLNYAAFYVMLLDREASDAAGAQTAPTTPPKPPLRSI